jgi:hypothetical protein
MTRRLAMIGSVLAALVFVTTLARPATTSESPPLVQAAAIAAGAFIAVWLLIPLVAYVAYLILTPVRRALRRSDRPDA